LTRRQGSGGAAVMYGYQIPRTTIGPMLSSTCERNPGASSKSAYEMPRRTVKRSKSSLRTRPPQRRIASASIAARGHSEPRRRPADIEWRTRDPEGRQVFLDLHSASLTNAEAQPRALARRLQRLVRAHSFTHVARC
jgi:hypothetical protein